MAAGDSLTYNYRFKLALHGLELQFLILYRVFPRLEINWC